MIELDIMRGPGDWAGIADLDAVARGAVEAAFAVAPAAPRSPVELSLLLTDDSGVQELNRAWRGLDKPTNVLSFPGSGLPAPDGARHLGDIALAFETIAREAEAEGKSLSDHLAHLIVHGTLHLVGHDHEGDEEAEAMEALETEALASLGIADPYRETAVPQHDAEKWTPLLGKISC
jgi:probable rRNA maturation factor